MLKKRGIGMCIILSLITFGFYSLFWLVGLANEFAAKNNKPTEGGKVILLTLITFGIYFIIWNYKMGNTIEQAGGKNEGSIYLILSIFGLSIISLALMQAQENKICDIKRLNISVEEN